MMNITDNFIDVFYSYSTLSAFHAIVWRDNGITESALHQNLEQTAAYCRQLGLPVMVNDLLIRDQLRDQGVAAQLFSSPTWHS